MGREVQPVALASIVNPTGRPGTTVMLASGGLSVNLEVVQHFKGLHALGMATVNLGVGSVSVIICTAELTVA